MKETKTTLLKQFQVIQELQFDLDKKKKEFAVLRESVRSLSQLIPRKIRDLNLK